MNKTTFPDDLEDDLFLDDPFVEDTIHSPNLIPETGDTTTNPPKLESASPGETSKSCLKALLKLRVPQMPRLEATTSYLQPADYQHIVKTTI